MSSDPGRFRRIAEIFAEAVHREGAERARYLDETCGDDAELRAEVLALLDHDEDAPTAFDDGRIAEATRAAVEEPLPESIGNYRIIGVIGRGAMGVVYRARQQSPSRDVALKVMRPGVFDAELERRFAHEAQVLGRLEHHGIARIYEAGIDHATGAAQPFIAMEFIRGAPLRAGRPADRIEQRRRIALLADICDAVQHAHQKGIIHRDLKPANVLVDEEGQPRVVDFGVARTMEADRMATLATSPGQLVGTLPYMSPEQVGGDPAAIDTRSDVFALGVMLFELLTGRRPHDLDGSSIYEAIRTVQEEPIPALSSIDRTLRGDLDVIAARATAAEPERRYQSARELAADLRHHLADEPIDARRDSMLYVVGRTIRRRRIPVAVITIITLLLAFVVWNQVQQRIDEAGYRVTTELFSIRDEVLDPFSPAAPPSVAQLKRASNWADRRVDEQPAEAADIYALVGIGFLENRVFGRAEATLDRALDLRRSLITGNDPDLATSLHDYGRAAYWQGDIESAKEHYGAALTMRRELLGLLVDPNERTQAEADIASSLNGVAACMKRLGQLEEAEIRYRESLAIRKRLGQERWVAAAINNLATCLVEQERWSEARMNFADALGRIKRFNVKPQFIASSHRSIARCDLKDEALERARHHLEEARNLLVDTFGRTDPHLLRCRTLDAQILLAEGDRAAALAAAQSVVADFEAAGNRPAEAASDAHRTLALIIDRDDPATARAHLRIARELLGTVLGPQHPRLGAIDRELEQIQPDPASVRGRVEDED